jgi:hypothetical protein
LGLADEAPDDKTLTAFVGGILEVLRVNTKKNSRLFVLLPISSPRFKARAQDFITLVDHQSMAPQIWPYLDEQIRHFLDLNGESYAEASTPQQLLQDQAQLWDSLGDSLTREVQVYLLSEGSSLSISPAQSGLLKEFSFNFDFGEPASSSTKNATNDYVYFYKERDVSVDQLIEMIEAQEESSEVRKRLSQLLKENEASHFLDLNSPEWKSLLKKSPRDQIETLVGWACRAVSNVCSEFNSSPKIPAGQEKFWGPSPAELKRIRAREGLQKNGFELVPFDQPWQFYEFRAAPLSIEDRAAAPDDEGEDSLEEYRQALKALIPFARKIRSPFEEAFRLADFILLHPKTIVGMGDKAGSFLKENSFSELAVEIFAEKAEMIARLNSMLFEESEIIRILSLEVSDVFGGMGSWNDQYFQEEALQKDFDSLSTALYAARNSVFQSILNYNSGS